MCCVCIETCLCAYGTGHLYCSIFLLLPRSLSLFPRRSYLQYKACKIVPIITCVATSTQVLHMEWNKCVLYFRRAHLCFHVTCFNEEVCPTCIFQEGTPKCDYTFFSHVPFQSGSVSSIFFSFIFFYQL